MAVLVMIALASFEAVTPLPAAAQHLESSLAAGRRLIALAEAPADRDRTHPDEGPSLGHTCAAPNAVRCKCAERVPSSSCSAASDQGTISGLASPVGPADEGSLPVISAEDLRFRYAEGEPWALDGLSFDLSPGEHLTIVGPSGSGKTTLVNLLLRFWDPQEGSIRIAGRDLRGLDPEDVRRHFGVVTQNTFLFSGTIRDNLLLARPDAGPADMEEAVARAQLTDFIRSLPDGYDTWVGELGLRMSGGERQRLAIARALLRDAPVLILDEPIANLDPVTARAVLDTVHGLMAGRSVISVTHSLIGIEAAAQVLVVRAGRIVERGRHADLLAQEGFYRKMWSAERGALEE
jgi:ATP-binding cassette subfamily C protein CydC